VAVAVIVTLMAFPRQLDFELTFRRVAWLPVASLLVQAILWKPLFAKLSYFAVVPLLITCIVSIVLAAVGATLVATTRGRHEESTALLRATLIAAIPGILLLGLMFFGFVSAALGTRGA
jgi:hypothetical protein